MRRNNGNRGGNDGGRRAAARTPWKDILENDALGDDTVIQVGEVSATLGELRTLNEETGGGTAAELDAREQALQKDQGLLITAQGELARMFQTLSDITGQDPKDLMERGLDENRLRARAGGGRGGNNNRRTGNNRHASTDLLGEDDAGDLLETATGMDRDDPLLKPVLDRLTKLESTDMKAIKDELKRTQTALGIALKVNMEEHYERTYNGYKFPELDEPTSKRLKFSRPTLTQVLKHAEDNGIKDRHGRLNVSRALDELTGGVRHKLELEQAEQRGAKRREDEMRAGSVTPPGATGQRHQLTKVSQRPDGTAKDFGEVLADAANDTDLWNSALSGMGGGQQVA